MQDRLIKESSHQFELFERLSELSSKTANRIHQAEIWTDEQQTQNKEADSEITGLYSKAKRLMDEQEKVQGRIKRVREDWSECKNIAKRRKWNIE